MAQRITDFLEDRGARARGIADFSKEEIESSLTARFARIAERHAGRIAISEAELSYTYAELNAAANRVANTLLDTMGDQAGRAALLFETSSSAVIGHLGTLKAGKTCVALDPNFPIARLLATFEDADTQTIVTTRAHADLAGELGARHIITLDDLSPQVSDLDPPIEIGPNTLAAIVYTSGSTGRPKGVMQTHRVLLHRAWADTHYCGISCDDRQSMLLSLTFGAGFPDVLSALLNGATLCPFNLRKNDLVSLTDWLEREAITIFTPPIAAFRQFYGTCPPGKTFTSCRIVNLAGEASVRADIEAFRRLFDNERCELINILAASETQIISRYRVTADVALPQRITPVGYAEADKELKALDESGREVADGEPGELVIRSAYLAQGYWRRPELTNAAFEFHDDGSVSYRSRDVVTIDTDGCIEHRGRTDHVVKLRGYRIELIEIEGVLTGIDEVSAAAASARDLSAGRPALVVHVVIKPGARLSADDVRRHIAEQLPDYMVPARVVFVDELPRTTNGKLDRRRIAELPIGTLEEARTQEQTEDKNQTRAITLTSELEQRFTEIWQSVLGVDDIGIHDDFFALGGDSLSMVRLATELRLVTGREFPIQSLLHAPTIAELVELVQAGDKPISLVRLSHSSGSALERRPLFCVLGLYLYKHLADLLAAEVTTYGIFIEGETDFLRPEQIGNHRFLTQRSPMLQLPGAERLAAAYIQEIRSIQPKGPYQLMGSSFGGVVAFEIARQFEADGEDVHLLAMLDSFAPGFRRPASLRGWASHSRRELLRHLPRRMPTRGSSLDEWDKLRVRARAEAERLYRPEPINGNALLIKAQQAVEFPGYSVDEQLGWGSLVKGRLTVDSVPGDHLGILAPPNVATLAQKISQQLDRSPWNAS